MSKRPPRKPTRRPEIHKSGDVRREQIREQIREGVTRPRDIAKQIGVSLDLVRWYGRRMDDVVYGAGRLEGRRPHIEFALSAEAAA